MVPIPHVELRLAKLTPLVVTPGFVLSFTELCLVVLACSIEPFSIVGVATDSVGVRARYP